MKGDEGDEGDGEYRSNGRSIMNVHMRLGLVAAAVLVVWAGSASGQAAGHAMAATPTKAVAVLLPTAGNSVHGIVRLEAVSGGVHITAQLEGLPPGEHGFHIHEFGDCSAGDGTSAGGHFNPDEVAHGGPEAATRHVGDLGNVTADAQGMATYDRVDSVVRLAGLHGVIGRGVIVHAGTDDLTSQPTGAAGARMACGVIGVAK